MTKFASLAIAGLGERGAGHGLCPRIVGNEDGPVIQYQGARC